MSVVLVLGRGAEAVRHVRACRDHGWSSVVGFDDLDLDAAHARLAERAVRLDDDGVEAVLAAAAAADADAVLPSAARAMDAPLSRAIVGAGRVWLGVDADGIEALAGVQRDAPATAAERIVAVDVLGDGDGVRVLGDRDRSLRRRGAAVLEVSPAPLDEAARAASHVVALEAVAGRRLGGIATIELAVAADGSSRVADVTVGPQPGHAALEALLGVDVVRACMRAASGGPSVPVGRGRGTAIALSVLAEDAGRGFLPSSGRLTVLEPPTGPGILWHGGAGAGDLVGAGDTLLGTIVAHAPDIDGAIGVARRALGELAVVGVVTTCEALSAGLDALADETPTAGALEHAIMPGIAPQARAPLATGAALVEANVVLDGVARRVRATDDAIAALARMRELGA